MHQYSERKNVFKECPKLVVLWLVSHSSLGKEFYSLGPAVMVTVVIIVVVVIIYMQWNSGMFCRAVQAACVR